MSGSGKSLLGVWLYRRGESWAVKEGSPLHKSRNVCYHIFDKIKKKQIIFKNDKFYFIFNESIISHN